MDKNEAKFILSSLRPDGQDDDMPQAQEALAMAKSDPELAKWLEQERELDRMLCDKLCECPVPDGLRESILAGGNHTIRPRFHWREAMPGTPLGKKSKKLFGKKQQQEQYYHQIFFHYVLQDGERAHCAWDRAR